MPTERRFIFNGSAIAFGGHIRRPDDKFLNSAAVAHLPVSGGLSESHIQGPDAAKYHYKDFLKFGEAYSRAHGDFTDPKKAAEYTHSNHQLNPLPTTTTVESRLLDLQIDAPADADAQTPRRQFGVKKLEVHMQTTSSYTAADNAIRSFTASFEGITLATGAGKPIELNVSMELQIFSDNQSKAKLMDKYASDSSFREKYSKLFHPLGEATKSFIGNMVGKHEIQHANLGPIVATFVSGLQWVGGEAPEGTEILNNRLTIPGLGRIFFGEIVIDSHYQRATLLRFELGSTNGADASAGEASSNGTWNPPHNSNP